MHKTFYHEAHEGHEVIKIIVFLLPDLFFVSFMRFMVNLWFQLRWA